MNQWSEWVAERTESDWNRRSIEDRENILRTMELPRRWGDCAFNELDDIIRNFLIEDTDEYLQDKCYEYQLDALGTEEEENDY